MGAGVFATFHARKYASFPDVTLVGVVDPVPAAAQRVSAELGVEALSDPRDLLGRVDAVSIASPADTHAELGALFLGAGVHVLMEKPLATRLEDADRLVRLARERDLILQVGHQERYVLGEFGLGPRAIAPKAIEAVRCGPFTGRGMDVSATLDLMIHDLDMVHALAGGEVTGLAVEAKTEKGRHPDEVTARFTLGGRCAVTLIASRIAEVRERRMRIIYPDGKIEIDFVARTLENTTPQILKPAFGGVPGAKGIADDPLGYALAAFLQSVRSGDPPLVDGPAARRALATALAIDTVAASARTPLHVVSS
ncbi:MAG: Gfo/Idh/MocA family oxidoreductase [Alphaproteobacteria bacterium]|nr:Gfo/Idh/MocA family oxidoreductase [Alphaproteobacteria bacterium]